MNRLAAVIQQFEGALLSAYGTQLLPSQRKALSAMKRCRTSGSTLMKLSCSACDHEHFVPHSCGHRNCPHCQNHESWQWIERECRKRVSANYFMMTFTLPAELRSLVFSHQRRLLSLLFRSVWETVQRFSMNDKQLGGMAGATAVLHTHSRQLAYHPHIHLVMPAAVIDNGERLWKRKRGRYLFNHKALAKVFRAKMLAGIKAEGLALPSRYPEEWVVDCRCVGNGEKALTYLGRYLYRGVIAERDIVSVQDGQVTFRYLDSNSGKRVSKTVSGAQFLWLVLQHILPHRFRRARSYGFLHPNSKRVTPLLRYLFKIDPRHRIKARKQRPVMACKLCGGIMAIIQCGITTLTHTNKGDLPQEVPG